LFNGLIIFYLAKIVNSTKPTKLFDMDGF